MPSMFAPSWSILAACETGRGTITGDGVDGLSRAFTWAAPDPYFTLWTVPELQTLGPVL